MAKEKTDSLVDLTDVVAAFRKNADKRIADQPEKKDPTGPLTGNPVTLGPRVISAEDWSKKQTERAAAAADTWAERVRKPRKNPVEAALAANDKRLDRLEEAKKLKKWEKAMAAIDIDLMYKTIETVGAAGFKAGIENRKEKIAARVKELQPLVEEVALAIDKMPVATDADREKRLLAARRLMIELGKKRRGL